LSSDKKKPAVHTSKTIVNAVKPLRRMVGGVARQIIGTITSIETDDRVAALTFDDGPHPEFTDGVLKVLYQHHARATFFMLGENASQYPEIVRRVADGGHAIANHSWDHPSLPLLTRPERRKQIHDCAGAIAPFGGTRFFRPPYGHQTMATRLDAFLLGYSVVMGDALAEDWWPRDAAWMATRLIAGIKPGSIVILHDRIARSVQDVPQHDRKAMISALDMALDQLSARFRFITVPELLTYGKPVRSYYFSVPPQGMVSRLNQHPLLKKKLGLSRADI
jgi:peptidoglycan/xylan/chitin deacetylase (PgdA/CDA1 family)